MLASKPAPKRGIGGRRDLECKRDYDVTEGAVNGSLMAYLMVLVAIVIAGAALWIAVHYRGKSSQGQQSRWLDAHYVDLMHHRH